MSEEKQMTPLQELIELLNKELESTDDFFRKSGIKRCIKVTESLLPKEKQMVFDSWTQGWNDRGNDDGDFAQYRDGEQYFNSKYQ